MNATCKSLAILILTSLCSALSTSAAQSWTPLTAPSTNIGPIACSADGSKLLLASGHWFFVDDVLYVSHDSGATWTAADVPTGAWSAVASSADGTVLLATLLPGAVFISRDSGATWSQAPLPFGYWRHVACSANGAYLYATANWLTNGLPVGVYASTDGGATWSKTGTPPSANGDWEPLACSADGTRVIAAEGPDVWISTNSGAQFRLAYTLNPPYAGPGELLACASLACSADGTTVAAGAQFAGNYRQVAVATSGDCGATWTWGSGSTPDGSSPCFIWPDVGVSADGRRIAAVGGGISPAGGLPLGPAMLSKNSGASWVAAPPVPWDLPPGAVSAEAPWSGLAVSADGLRLTGVYLEGLYPAFGPSVLAWQTASAPAIHATVSAGGLVLSWIVPSVACALQQSPDFSATNWTDVPTIPVLNYSTLRHEVSLPASARQMFYRLVPAR